MSKSQPTPEEMAKRVARYRDLRPCEAMAASGVRFGD